MVYVYIEIYYLKYLHYIQKAADCAVYLVYMMHDIRKYYVYGKKG